MIRRRKAKPVKVGNRTIGGNTPVVIQSMCNVKTSRVAAVVKQIQQLEKAGCELVRVAVLDKKDARAIRTIQKEIAIPLCADIHFNYVLALEAIRSGADKVRINPGNIAKDTERRMIIDVARERKIPIRIGANSGSIEERIKRKTKDKAKQLAFSVLETVNELERKTKYHKFVLSVKAHDVHTTIAANRIIAAKSEYPIHLGVTAAGRGEYSIIKSAVALGSLLQEGIGDTIRVSLTDKPWREVIVAREILESVGLRKRPCEVIACPTCGRAEINVINLAKEVERLVSSGAIKVPKQPYQIAVMGCVVNGPGESKAADIGITGGRGFGFLFKKGKLIKKVKEKGLLKELVKEIRNTR